MIEIKSISVENTGPFKTKQTFRIPKGISYVYGLDTRTGSGNAVGKSLLFNAVFEIFGDPLIGVKQDRIKTGTRTIVFNNSNKVAIQASGTKLAVKVDGELKTARINKNTTALIKRYWPLSDTDLRTYGIIDSIAHHPLVRGTTAQRKEFFTDFFRLDQIDRERKLIRDRLIETQRNISGRDQILASIRSAEAQRIEIDHNKINHLQSKWDRMVKDHERYEEISRLLEFERLVSKELPTYKKLVNGGNYQEVTRKAQEDVSVLDNYDSTVAEYEEQMRRLREWRNRASKVDLKTDLDTLKRRSSLFSNNSWALEVDPEEKPREIQKPEKFFEGNPQEYLGTLYSKKAEYERHLQLSSQGKCPTCGQSVRGHSNSRERLSKVVTRIDKVEQYIQQHQKYRKYREKLLAWETHAEAHQKAKRLATKYRNADTQYESRISLGDKPRVTASPEKPSTKYTREDLRVLRFFEPYQDQLEKLRDVDRSVSFSPEKFNVLQEKLSKLKSDQVAQATLRHHIKDLKRQYMSVEVEDESMLKLLLEAYSDKAVKKLIIESISSLLMKTVNEYAAVVFPSYRFEFVWGTQIHILVHRKRGITTDVRKLSGAESKVFTLILVMSLLRFVPPDKRLSLLVLDEPTSSFHKKTTEQLLKILPLLNQVIPSIIVVTPKTEERMPGALEFTILRDKDGSKIVEGHPSSLRLGLSG